MGTKIKKNFFTNLIFIFLIFVALVLILNTQTKTNEGQDVKGIENIIQEISAEKAIKIIDEEDIILIDIRAHEEFEGNHIPNAINIDLSDPLYNKKLQKLDKEEKYIIYCQSGKRGINGLEVFNNHGFKEVYNIKGGIIDWKKVKKDS